MSDKKISQFTELTAPSTGDFLPVVDTSSSTTKKIKLSIYLLLELPSKSFISLLASLIMT